MGEFGCNHSGCCERRLFPILCAFLPYFSKFILFVVAYTAVSGILTWISSLVQMKLGLIYQRKLSWRIEEALGQIDLRFYTMGDISTRYQMSMPSLQRLKNFLEVDVDRSPLPHELVAQNNATEAIASEKEMIS